MGHRVNPKEQLDAVSREELSNPKGGSGGRERGGASVLTDIEGWRTRGRQGIGRRRTKDRSEGVHESSG